MEVDVVRSFEEIRPLLGQICRIADSNRSAFGFLPETAYSELAAREQLWVAQTPSNVLAGYVLFGTAKSRIRIFQLFVDETERGTGIGSSLVSELKKLASERGYQTLSARVAADLPANTFWKKQGFRVIRQVAGGQTRDRLINERFYEVLGCSLWESAGSSADLSVRPLPLKQPILSVANFAIDLNALFDVTKDREHATLMRDVIANALSNEYRLCVTSEFSKELERTTIPNKDDPILTIAKSLPTLPSVPSSAIEPLIAELREVIFPERSRSAARQVNDRSDLTHLALCIHHKASGFITRESAILRRSQVLRETYGLDVLSPADLSTGDLKPEERVIPVYGTIGGREFSVAALKEEDRQRAEMFLQKQGLSKLASAAVLNPGTNKAPRIRLVFSVDTRVVAIATWGPVTRHVPELRLYLMVDEGIAESQRAVDHVLEVVAHSSSNRKIIKIELMTSHAQMTTRETASKRGFVLNEAAEPQDIFSTSSRYSYRGIVSEKSWNKFAEQVEVITGSKVTRRCPKYEELTNTGLLFEHRNSNYRKLVPLFELETAFAPVLVLARDRPAVIVPVREDYANDLISTATKQFTLFPKEAPLHLERAYFGKPGIERAFVRGAIVVFYISGRRNEAVGLARVTASGRYTVEEALVAFFRQGVLTAEELKKVSVDGEVGIFTFDGYRNLAKPIPFTQLRAHEIANAANLVTSQVVPFEKLLDIVSLGEAQ